MIDFPMIPLTKRAVSNKSPLHGWGINDSWYQVSPIIDGVRFVCPYYTTWRSLISRSYCIKEKIRHPYYKDCTSSYEWTFFSKFREWMIDQDWEGKQLDKDIIKPGNKIYCPDFCAFIPGALNTLLNNRSALRGKYPIGVTLNGGGKFQCIIGINGSTKYLGQFNSPEQANQVYRIAKSDHVKSIAILQTDPRVKAGLLLHAELILNGKSANG